MGRLADLPPELLGEISENLAQDDEQEALAALALQNRLLYSIVNPLLYRQPRITTLEQLGDWVSTLEHWQQLLEGGEKMREMPVIKSISFAGLIHAVPYSSSCSHCGSRDHRTHQHGQTLILLLPLVLSHTFDHLHALSFVDCEAPAELLPHLLGPLEPLRSTIKELTLVRTGYYHSPTLQFLLHLLHFFPDNTVRLNAIWDERNGHPNVDWTDRASISQQLRRRALTDYDAFECLTFWSLETNAETIPSVLAVSPSPYPFSKLTTLKLGLESNYGEEIYIALCSGLFPSLVRLTFFGSFRYWTLHDEERFLFRRAVHHPPPRRSGELRPPQLSGDVPDDEEALWEPLTTEEVASKAYTDYRGPSLDLLDLSEVTFSLQG